MILDLRVVELASMSIFFYIRNAITQVELTCIGFFTQIKDGAPNKAAQNNRPEQ